MTDPTRSMTRVLIACVLLAMTAGPAPGGDELPLVSEIVRQAVAGAPDLAFESKQAPWQLKGGAARAPGAGREGGAALAIPAGGQGSLSIAVPRGNVHQQGKRYLVSVRVKRDHAESLASLTVTSGGGSSTAQAGTAGDWEELTAFADTAFWFPGHDRDTLAITLAVTGSGRALFEQARVYEIPAYGVYFRFRVEAPAEDAYQADAFIIRRHRDKNHRDPIRHYYQSQVTDTGGAAGVPAGRYSPWIDLRPYLFGQGLSTVGLRIHPVGQRHPATPLRITVELAYHVDDGKRPLADGGAAGGDRLRLDAPQAALGDELGDAIGEAIQDTDAVETARVFFRTTRQTEDGVLGFLLPENNLPPNRFLAAPISLEEDAERRHRWLGEALAPPGQGAGPQRILTGANFFSVENLVSPNGARVEADMLASIGIRVCRDDRFRQARRALYGSDAPLEFVYARLDNTEWGVISPYAGTALADRMDAKYRAMADSLLAAAGDTPPATWYIELQDEPGNLGATAEDQPEFRAFLQRLGVTPDTIGAAAWDQVFTFGFAPASPEAPLPAMPERDLNDRNGEDDPAGQLEAPDVDAEDARDWGQDERGSSAVMTLPQRRHFYYTRLFSTQKTADVLATASRMARRHLPNARTLVNFRSGVRRVLTPETADWFKLGRERAVDVMWNEDWVNTYGWRGDGIQLVSYYTELMRTAARKHDLPVGGFLMCYWGQAERKTWSALAHGSRFIHFWRYGPHYANYLPYSWSNSPSTVLQIARFCRDVERLEPTLADAKREPARIALLYAKSDPLWGRSQTEHRMLYFALLHEQLPVDLITEAEIEEDGLLERYACLYIGDVSVQRATLAKVADWVRRGGRLWLSAEAATRDEFDEPADTLTAAFGLSQAPPGGQARVLPTPACEPEATVAEPLAIQSEGARVTLSFTDGTPAQVAVAAGQGMVCANAFRPGQLYPGTVIRERGKLQRGWSTARRRWITGFALDQGLERPVAVDVPCVEAILYRHPGQDIAIVINYSGDDAIPAVEVQIDCPGKVSDVESLRQGTLPFTQQGDTVRLTMPLAVGDAILLRHDRQTHNEERP